jgi:hypothetical protein
MVLARVEHVLERDVGREVLKEVKRPQDVDWEDTLPETRKLVSFEFVEEGESAAPARTYLNPAFKAEVIETHRDRKSHTLTIDTTPWELRGHLWLDDDRRILSGWLELYAPTEDAEMDWGANVGDTTNVLRVRMNGEEHWDLAVNPAFGSAFSRGMREERRGQSRDEGEAVVEIVIDDDSPWRIKSGQISIDDHQGNWVLRSSPLVVVADELDWEFTFASWAEE